MPRAAVHGPARLGHRAGDLAGERRERIAVRQAVPVALTSPDAACASSAVSAAARSGPSSS